MTAVRRKSWAALVGWAVFTGVAWGLAWWVFGHGEVAIVVGYVAGCGYLWGRVAERIWP